MEHISIVEVLVGLPASGKSTHAKTLVDKGYVRLNKDCIRDMLYFEAYSKENEDVVDKVEMGLLLFLLASGKNIVVDDCNLNPERIKLISDTIDSSPFNPAVAVNNQFCFVPLVECLKRDKARGDKVGAESIKRLYEKYRDQFPFDNNL